MSVRRALALVAVAVLTGAVLGVLAAADWVETEAAQEPWHWTGGPQ